MESKEYLTAKETADFIGIAQSYLYKLTARHTIPFYNPTGHRLLFKRLELKEWIESNGALNRPNPQTNSDKGEYLIIR